MNHESKITMVNTSTRFEVNLTSRLHGKGWKSQYKVWCIIVTFNMSVKVYNFTGNLIVCWKAYPDWQQKHQSSVLLSLCTGNPPVTGGFPAQSHAERVLISGHHHRTDRQMEDWINEHGDSCLPSNSTAGENYCFIRGLCCNYTTSFLLKVTCKMKFENLFQSQWDYRVSIITAPTKCTIWSRHSSNFSI